MGDQAQRLARFAFHHVLNVCESPGQKPGFRFRSEPALSITGAVIPMRHAGSFWRQHQRAVQTGFLRDVRNWIKADVVPVTLRVHRLPRLVLHGDNDSTVRYRLAKQPRENVGRGYKACSLNQTLLVQTEPLDHLILSAIEAGLLRTIVWEGYLNIGCVND